MFAINITRDKARPERRKNVGPPVPQCQGTSVIAFDAFPVSGVMRIPSGLFICGFALPASSSGRRTATPPPVIDT